MQSTIIYLLGKSAKKSYSHWVTTTGIDNINLDLNAMKRRMHCKQRNYLKKIKHYKTFTKISGG